MQPKSKSLIEIEKEEENPPSPIENLATKGSFFMPRATVRQLTDSGDARQNDLFPYYYHTNSYSPLLKNLHYEVFSQIDDCQKLWQEFSPNTTLFDTWDFRLAFWKGYNHIPYFLVLKNNLENFALLPLWYEKDKKKYTWFGSTWQEENKFLVKDPLFIPLLLNICPSPVILNAISAELPLWIKKTIKLKPDDPKYILKLETIKSADDYLSTLKKKKRHNFKRDRRIIEAQNPHITFNNFADFDNMVKLSMRRFEEKGEDTDWEDSRRVETFRQIIKLGQAGNSYKIRMITVIIDNKVAAVDLIALFNDCYSPLKCGYDVKNFPGIGNFVNLLEIDDAINLGMKKMDFLEIGYGWKENWFEAIPLLQYEKK
ncbi:hypothetical protein COT63_00190 [Candidatus Shapirobacteria bacterium CG09_land_8_20_14_0_10_38_17]|uniref:BioF2-like acetyltransferase domain-containing protein n=1 Tax=Candidatus Shapirobacteria bacterium CG09_land_8_20_14_0_10_38_17 TaxID=1974884 RepID=A0A2H0WRU0_9BACT|nr:MAG: hypothetical protein COT63_00190 [Candidatus Shapirobacteria bacterium CG09_land_8_20_14_0_10_38_17]